LSNTSKNSGQETPLIDQANSINLSMVEKIVKRIEKRIDLQLLGAKIQIIGIAYKVNVPDMRESPALELINKLRSLGALVTWHDPVVKYFEGESSVPLSLDIDLGLIVTPHDIIDISIWKSSKLNVLDLSITKSDLGWPKFL
jgi:UDP-N-acetyl-D-glucosamine dehydrogenase